MEILTIFVLKRSFQLIQKLLQPEQPMVKKLNGQLACNERNYKVWLALCLVPLNSSVHSHIFHQVPDQCVLLPVCVDTLIGTNIPKIVVTLLALPFGNQKLGVHNF